jgi:flagellar protein FlgJ
VTISEVQSAVSPATPGEARKPDDPAKIKDAAQQFEALLIGQILRSVRESGAGWLGSGGDPSGDCATEFAEQHLANVLAAQGGLGLATLIGKGLEPHR